MCIRISVQVDKLIASTGTGAGVRIVYTFTVQGVE